MATLKLHSWYVQHWPEASYSNADDKPQHWRQTTFTFGIAPIGIVGGGLIEYGISDISNNCFLPEDPVVNLTRHTNARSRRLIELFLWAGCTVGIVGAIAGLVLTVTRWPYPAGAALAGYGIVNSIVFALLASRVNRKRPQSPQPSE